MWGEPWQVWSWWESQVTDFDNCNDWGLALVSAIPVRSSCSIYQRTPVIPVRSQQHTGVSVTIHLSSRQSFSPRWSMWSLYTSVFLSHTLRRQNHQKSFRLRQLCGQNDEGTQERISAVLLRDDKNNHSSNIIAGNRAESGTSRQSD